MQLAALSGLPLWLSTLISVCLCTLVYYTFKFYPQGKSKKWIVGGLILATVATPIMKGITVGNITLIAVFYGFLLLENIFPRSRKELSGNASVKQAIYNIIRPVFSAWLGVAFVPLVAKYVPFSLFSLKDMNLSLFAQAMIFLFLWDFKEYWWHRAGHKFDLVWRVHKVHHASTKLGVLAWAPTSIIEHVFCRGLSTLVLAALVGFDSAAFPIFVFSAFLIGGAGAHSNIELPRPGKIPLWAKLIVTPKNHQYHHTLTGMYYNYGFITPLWDIMFGTFHMPEEKITEPYGFGDPEFSSMGFWGDQISPLVPDKFVKKYFARKELIPEAEVPAEDKTAKSA